MAFSDTGDFNLFVDDDDKGYVIYTSHIVGYDTTHRISVELLADDYCSSLLNQSQSGFFGDSFVEAPAMFKRDKTYYGGYLFLIVLILRLFANLFSVWLFGLIHETCC
jgi:beta-xylosidase